VIDGAFVQFYFKHSPLAQLVLPAILNLKGEYGKNDMEGLRDPLDPAKGRKKVGVNFGSPNIAKPINAGHLRSTIIGGFIANVYEESGWGVVRLNYLGDCRKEYGVLAVGYREFGKDEALESDPVGHLFDVYVKISAIDRDEQTSIKEKQTQIEGLKQTSQPIDHIEAEAEKLQAESVDEQARQYFKRMCDGEADALQLWKKFRDLSIVEYEETFARLNIQFDEYWGESQVKDESMQNALAGLEKTGVSEESQGATIVDLTRYKKSLGKAIVRKKEVTSIYLTRDIGGVFDRTEMYGFDKMIFIIANQQDLHMAQVIKIIVLMGREDLAGKLQHVNFGLVNGMSTRRSTVKFLDDILRDTADKMHEVMKRMSPNTCKSRVPRRSPIFSEFLPYWYRT
jgi:arginyl-tRNA synthetase